MKQTILQIRGDSGAGKTTLVKKIATGYYTHRINEFVNNRTIPIASIWDSNNGGNSLTLVGNYRFDTSLYGGCDTIISMQLRYDIAQKYADLGHDVIFEGLLMSGDTKHALNFMQKHPLTVITLNMPHEVLIESRAQRRRDENKPRRDETKVKKDSFNRRIMRCNDILSADPNYTGYVGLRDDCFEFAKQQLQL